MYLGTFLQKLDDKGRLFLPAKFREQLRTGLVITRQPERCLAIWPIDAFIADVGQTASGPSASQKVREFQRMVASGASDDAPDEQGRVTVPPALRAYAGLVKEIVVIGAYNRLEIWDQEKWAEYSAAQEDVFADLDETD